MVKAKKGQAFLSDKSVANDRLNDETKRKCDRALKISMFTRSFEKEIVLRFLFKDEGGK